MTPPTQQPTVVVVNQKSLVLGLILTFFFGPLGMLYSTIMGGLVMLVISGIIGFFTGGLGLALTWPIQMIWTWMAISTHNKGQAAAVRRMTK